MFYVKTYIFDFEKKNIKHNINIRESVCFFDSGIDSTCIVSGRLWQIDSGISELESD